MSCNSCNPAASVDWKSHLIETAITLFVSLHHDIRCSIFSKKEPAPLPGLRPQKRRQKKAPISHRADESDRMCWWLDKGSGACSESLSFDAELLQQRQIKIAERNFFQSFRRQLLVLAMLKAATGKNDREIFVSVRVCIGHAASEKNHRLF